MMLDAIAIHLVETTASSGAAYRPTQWAAMVRYVVHSRQLYRDRALLIRRMAHGQTLHFPDGSKVEIAGCPPIDNVKWSPKP